MHSMTPGQSLGLSVVCLMGLMLIPLMLIPMSAAHATDCKDWEDGPQQKMNYCSFLDYQAADKVLNQVWGVVSVQVKSNDADMPSELKGWSKALLKAQRAWILYRDNHCESEGFKFRGGTMEPLIVSGCKARMTRQRTEELKLLIEDG